MNKYGPEFLAGMGRQPLSLGQVEEAIKNKEVLEALVVECSEDKTLKLNIGRGIIGEIKFEDLQYSASESDLKPVSALAKIGKRVKFIPKAVTKASDGTHIVECNRRELQIECYKNYIDKLVPGDIVQARAIRIEDYGIFCDIGCGIVALLPTNFISVTHIVNPKESLKNINTLYVVIKEKQDNNRIQVTHKELLGTWLEEAEKFKMDDVVQGTVLSVEDYGVFVRLSQNLSGLTEPTKYEVEPGDRVMVRVNMILKNSMKIKLDIVEKLPFEQEKLKFVYKQTEGHIDEWNYSVDTAKKKITTVFR